MERSAVHACLTCARVYQATLQSAGCAYHTVVKLCDRFGLLLAPPSSAAAGAVLLPSVLSEEKGCARVNGAEALASLAGRRGVAGEGTLEAATARGIEARQEALLPESTRGLLRGANPNPADCKLAAWGLWSSCDVSCGGGKRVRARAVRRAARAGGSPCGPVTQLGDCAQQPCGAATGTGQHGVEAGPGVARARAFFHAHTHLYAAQRHARGNAQGSAGATLDSSSSTDCDDDDDSTC